MATNNTEQVNEFISDSQTAFLNGKYKEAFELAKQAIALDSKNANAYQCAANACMSLERYEDAVEYYKNAIKNDPENGTRYFNLGYAQATNNKIADAIQSFAKADELGLSNDAAAQMYHILGIVNQQLGHLDDAIINLTKSEMIIPGDLDVMKRKAVIYGLKNEISNGLNVANQMKLVLPSDYSGYQVAYALLMQAGRFEDAFKELIYARRNLSEFPFDLCKDMIDFDLAAEEKDGDWKHFKNALSYIKYYMKKEKPTVEQVINLYITAAEIYLNENDADNALICLNAANNPVASYNNGVFYYEFDPKKIDQKSILNEMNANLFRYEKLSMEQLETMHKNGTYITPTDDKTEQGEYKFPEDMKFEISPSDEDNINRIFIGVYTLKKDYRKIMYYALKLQKSSSEYLVEMGLYQEAKAMKDLNYDGWQDKYEEVQKKLRNNVLIDPTDMNAQMLRVKCLIDLEKYDEAEKLCEYLRDEIRKPLIEEIRKAKNGDNGDNIDNKNNTDGE